METKPFVYFREGDKAHGNNRKNANPTVKFSEIKLSRFPFVRVCRANTTFNFRAETRNFERGIAEKPKKRSELLVSCMEIVCWRYILKDGELGADTNGGLLVGSAAMPPPIFALIRNDHFFTNFVLKNWCF